MSDDVPRETPPVPESARGVFADRLGLAAAYADLLTTDGVVRGLLGPREAPRVWERHLLNCAVLADAVAPGSRVCDIGSGAGLPGLVLAVRRPDLHVTLVEPLLRRSTFLAEAVERLGLERVEVRRARAEELHGQLSFDVVTSRAVAPLPRLLDWSLPLVREGGELLALKGARAADEVDQARRHLQRWRLEDVAVLQLGADVIDPPASVVRARVGAATRLRWERQRSTKRRKGRS